MSYDRGRQVLKGALCLMIGGRYVLGGVLSWWRYDRLTYQKPLKTV